MRAKILLLVVHAAAFLGFLLTPALRRERKHQALLCYGFACMSILTFLEGWRWYIYLVHALPVYCAVLAVWAGWLYDRGGRYRAVVSASLALFVLYSAATVIYRARLDDYHRVYVATLDYLRTHVQPGDLVMGSAEFGPGLGFREHVLVDRHLGYRNHLEARWIVLDAPFRERSESTAPEIFHHLERTLAQCRLVYESPPAANAYAVYVRR